MRLIAEKMTTTPPKYQPPPRRTYTDLGWICAALTGPATFLAVWIYCAVAYGFLLGGGLGWIPALILALLVAVGAAMQTFVLVVDTGSFSAAARRLNVGQPAVSKLIGQLEERLGVKLLGARVTPQPQRGEKTCRTYQRPERPKIPSR